MEDADKAKRADQYSLFTLFNPTQWSAIRSHFGLTPRQSQICKYICQGQADKNIATELGITLDTVRMHLREIFRKLGVQSRVKLVVKLVITNRQLHVSSMDASETATDARSARTGGRQEYRICGRT